MSRRLVVLLVASLIGLVASIWLTKSHFKLATEGFDARSFCTISEFIDCDTALASRWSKIGTIPSSEFGVLYYAFVFVAILVALSSASWRPATLSFLLASSVFAVGYSAVMAYLSFFRLGVLCLLCLTTYLVNLLYLFLFPGTLGISLARTPAYLAHYLKAIFVKTDLRPRLVPHLVAVVLFFGVGLLFFRGLRPEIHKAYAQVPPAVYLKHFYSLPVETMDLTGHPSRGRADAKVTVTEFSDFQCPFCRRAAFTLKPYLGEFRKEVRFVYVNYPLDGSCNPAIQRAMHPVACLAAKGALCADQGGKFWEYHDRVFENQKRLARATLVEIAKSVGLDEGRFNDCLVSPEAEALLKRDVTLGSRVKVQGTPTVFVNGRLFRDWGVPERLRLVIESELKGSPVSAPVTSPAPVQK